MACALKVFENNSALPCTYKNKRKERCHWNTVNIQQMIFPILVCSPFTGRIGKCKIVYVFKYFTLPSFEYDYLCTLIKNLKSRRLRWAGHVAHVEQFRNAYRALVEKPEGKKPLRCYFAGSAHRGCCQLKPTATSGSNKWGISLNLPSGSGRSAGSVALLLMTRVAFCCQDNLQ